MHQRFENRWYRAELGGRAIMIMFVAAGLIGLFGRGPLSHRRSYAPGGSLSVDYEPVAPAHTSTTVTLHVPNESPLPRPVSIFVEQQMLEPMGLQRTAPLADSSTVAQKGIEMRFVVQANQPDSLIRIELQPNALGAVDLRADDGARSVNWSMFVVP